MKKKDKRILTALIAGALCLCGAAAAVGEGTATDPLVTLSYLTQTVAPELVRQMDAKVDEKAAQLESGFTAAIDEYSRKMEQALGSAGGDAGSANYTLVTVEEGQKIHLTLGSEAMLRVGSAKCVADSSPGLIDSTDGTSLNNGKQLVKNHVYLATIEGRAISAAGGTAKVLVRGGYTVE